MSQNETKKYGPYRLVRMLQGTRLWTEHLAVYETKSGHGEACRLWFPKRGAVKNEKAAAHRLASLLALRHENLDRVVDAGVGERGLYVAFEYQPGRMLDEIVRAVGTEGASLPVSVCLYLGIEALKGLSAVQADDHGADELHHGFVGPQSIYVSTTGQVRLRYQGLAAACDWDIESLKGAFDLVGKELSHSEDIRAIALTLKHLLFPPESGAFKTGPEMPAGLARIIARALSPAPQLCFNDAEAMLSELLKLQTKLWEVCTAVQMSELMQQLFGGELDEDNEEVAHLTGAKRPPVREPRDLRLDRSLPLGSMIDGRYRLIREIGQGAAGIVYEAEHVELKTQVAIKMLDRDYCRDVHRVERFRREARASSRIGHPNIIRVSDLGQTDDGRFYYVMDYIEGETLGDLIRRVGFLDEERAVAIMTQVCDAVHAAHEKGIVHRDLKPENILLDRNSKVREFARVVDFGLSLSIVSNEKRLTKEGQAVGTPYFMAPEQVRGEPSDARTDVYAAGVILYEALSGAPMFDYPTVAETLTAHLHDTPVPFAERAPDNTVRGALEAAILKAVEKDPLDRHQSMKEMGNAIEAALEPSGLLAAEKPPPAPRKTRSTPPFPVDQTFEPASVDVDEPSLLPWHRRPPQIVAIIAAVTLVIGAVIVLWPRGGQNTAGASGGIQPPSATNQDAGNRVSDGTSLRAIDAGGGTATNDSSTKATDSAVSEGADTGPAKTDTKVQRPHLAKNVTPTKSNQKQKVPAPDSGAQQGPSAAELVRDGRALLSRGQPAKAARLCRQALRISAGSSSAWACVGQASFEQGNHSSAAQSFKRAVSMAPRSVRYRLLLAGALKRAGRSADANREYQEVLRLDPDNSIARRMLNR